MMSQWDSFKDTLPHQELPFSKRNWGNALHSVCSYQAKMKPALAHHLVEAFSSPGDMVVDPFSGSGTIPFEACLTGRRGYGMDISSLGTVISNAKLMPAQARHVDSLLGELGLYLQTGAPPQTAYEDAETICFNGPLKEYFHPNTFAEILLARDFLNARRDDSPEWYLVMACMLHILHGNRPYALSRNSHPITPYAPTGDFVYKSVIDRLSTKVHKSLAVPKPTEFVAGRCFQADIAEAWPSELVEIDTIITSPPFFDSTKFYITNWMRFWFCGWGRDDFDTQSRNFVEVTQKKSMTVYTTIFEHFVERLKPNGLVVLHLGFSRKCDMAKELSTLSVNQLEIVDLYDETVSHCESHGIRDKGTVTGHQYLVLRKPGVSWAVKPAKQLSLLDFS